MFRAERRYGTAAFALNGGAVTNAADRMVIGCFSGSTGTMTVDGGEAYSAGGVTIAEKSGSEGVLEITGGTVYSRGDALVGEAGKGTLTIGGTGVFECQTAGGGPLWLKLGVGGSSDNTINLNEGGELKIWHIEHYNASTGANVVNFNGGTMTSLGNNGNTGRCLIGNYESYNTTAPTVRILKKGGTINTAKFVTNIERATLESGVEEGQTDGGLTITGKGILNLNAVAAYNGLTYVESGVLALTNGYAFAGPVKVGKKGAIAVDVTAAKTASVLEVNGKIALFSFKGDALEFGEATDTLATSVFLTGPVVGYEISSVTAEGRTTVYATITDVANIDKTRKVTTFVAGAEFDDTAQDPLLNHHVDQNASFSNGMPANDSYDVVVFPGDAVMYIYSERRNNKDVINNRSFGDLAVRGGTLAVVASNGNNARWPNLGVKHVAGNGTLYLARIGLSTQNHDSLVVDECVNVEASTQGIRADIPATQDVWFGGTGATSVDGDVFVTNGIMKVQAHVTFNGDVTIGAYSTRSWLDADGTVFNGDLILFDGAVFNCNGKTATFGEDARLVLKGGTLANTNNITEWPKTVIQGGVYTYGAVPGAAEYTLAGGRLNVVPATDELGATMTLAGVKLADGVNAADVVQMVNTKFAWRYTVDGTTGKITAEAYGSIDDSVPNEWIGGAAGELSNGANWTRGLPVEGQILAFVTDAVIDSEHATLLATTPKVIVNEGVSLSIDLSALGDVTGGDGVALVGAFEGNISGITFTDSRAWDWTASVGQDGKLYATPKSTYQNHWVGGDTGL